MENDLLQQLNDSQRVAVEYCDGPSLVIAGAGSGKTRVLTYKIAYLLQNGMMPWNILALTFTNKAANEMKERIGNLVGMKHARQLNMGTFHSVFSRILRVEAEHIGYSHNFTIYDEADSRSLLKTIIKEMDLDDKIYKPAAVHARISMAKNHLISPSQYALSHTALERDRQSRMPALSMIFSSYCQRCRQANAMDFDDLLVLTYELFQRNDLIRQKYSEHFHFVLVDEYQDTNFAQQCIIMQLTKERQRVCVVGDDAQSIYGFRGANIDNMLDFQKHYPTMRLFKLEQNYRSTQRIVQAANSLIRKNERQIPKDVYSQKDEGEKLIYRPAYSDREEAIIVCNEIRRIKREEKGAYKDFAVLYRTNAQSRSFEEQMLKDNIPYRIYGGLSFYQRKEIKDVIAYFRLIANAADEEAFKRIVNYPARGIGNTTLSKIGACAQSHQVSYWDVVSQPLSYGLDVNKGTMTKLTAFRDMIRQFQTELPTTDAYTLGNEVIKATGIAADIYSSKDPEAISRQENLEEFQSGMKDFVEICREEGNANCLLPDFLQEISLLTDQDSENGQDDDRVSLMTIHSAKGLEFPTVFVVGLEENIFPSPMACDSKRELEEERRLFYVAITRAEKHCILTNAKNRWRYGKMEFDTPSRFIADIDRSLIRKEDENGGASTYERGNNSFSFEVNRPYMGTRQEGGDYPDYGHRMQNSRPVASQFRADVKPKITSPRTPEKAVDPFSDGFKRTLAAAGGNLRRIDDAMRSGGRAMTSSSASSSAPVSLHEGSMIEHQRFGVGKVVAIEGEGENAKATVDFKNAGRKQLLLKFARYTVIG